MKRYHGDNHLYFADSEIGARRVMFDVINLFPSPLDKPKDKADGAYASAGQSYAWAAATQLFFSVHGGQDCTSYLNQLMREPCSWMLEDEKWQPESTPRGNLIKSIAFLVAEVERIDRELESNDED